MLVLAAIPGLQLHRLRRAAATRFTLAHAASWDEALAAIRSRPVELAVVDPLLVGSASDKEIERLRVLFPSLPLILYTSLSPETAAVLLTLGQRGIRHVVFARYDDHPLRLREVLGQEGARTASRLFSSSSPARSRRCRRSCGGYWKRRCRPRRRCRPWARSRRARAWTGAPASAGSPASGCQARGTSWRQRGCSMPTACSRTQGSPLKTCRNASATLR